MSKIIPLIVYPFDVMVSFDEEDSWVQAALKKFKVGSKEEISAINMDGSKGKIGRMLMFSSKQTIIRLNFMPSLDDPYEMGLLNHEIFHAVGFIMEEIDTPLNKDTHEAYAYLFQYLTERIYSLL